MKSLHGGDIWQAARERDLAPESFLDFSASICPLGPSPLVEGAITGSLSVISNYPDPSASEFVDRLSAYHLLDSSNIIVGNGSIELLYMIPAVFKPKKALILEPAFSDYRRSLEFFGCCADSFICHEQDSFVPDIEALIDRLATGGYDILYIANPANPTGALIGRGDLESILMACERFATIMVIDEAFCDFVEEASIKDLVASSSRLVVLRSMTKFFALAGLRLGYMLSNKAVIEDFRALSIPWSVNTLALSAGCVSLEDGEHMKAVYSWFTTEQPFLFDLLSHCEHIVAFPSSVNFFIIKLPHSSRGGSLVDKLRNERILVRGLGDFTSLDDGFIRVSVRRRGDNLLLVEGLKRILSECAD